MRRPPGIRNIAQNRLNEPGNAFQCITKIRKKDIRESCVSELKQFLGEDCESCWGDEKRERGRGGGGFWRGQFVVRGNLREELKKEGRRVRYGMY